MTRRFWVFLGSALAACGGGDITHGVETSNLNLTTDTTTSPGTTSPGTTSPGTTEGIPTGTTVAPTTTMDAKPEPPPNGAPGLGFCSDGLHSEDEECDDGHADNQVDKECDPFCKKTWCGDKKVQLDEECDEGDTANVPDPLYGGCTEVCQLGPHCGDEVVQAPDEECEPGDTVGGANCGANCHYFTRILFLASQPTSGAMGGLTGMMGADEHCQDLADQADIPGTFMAWLMVDGQDLEARFGDFGDFAAPVHIRTLNDEPLAESFDALVKKGPAHAVATTEFKKDGAYVSLYKKQVWTNITSNGLPHGGDCGDWKQADATTALVGISGYADEDSDAHKNWVDLGRWTDTGFARKCYDSDIHVYCIQVK